MDDHGAWLPVWGTASCLIIRLSSRPMRCSRSGEPYLASSNLPSLYSRRNKRDLLRQPTKGGFSTIGTIVTIHRRGTRDRSSWTDRTTPKNFDPFKLSSAVRPKYWAWRQRRASTELLVSTVCTMTSFGQAAHSISQALTKTLAFHSSRFSFRRPQ